MWSAKSKKVNDHDGKPMPCVSTGDLAFLIAWFFCFENQIAWHKKRVQGTLEKYPEGHDFKKGTDQPKDDDAAQAAIGKAYFTVAMRDQKDKRVYYEAKPRPVVSVFVT